MGEQERRTTELMEEIDLDSPPASEICKRLREEGYDPDDDTTLARLINIQELAIVGQLATRHGEDRELLVNHLEELESISADAINNHTGLRNLLGDDIL
jgi:hypothetical protein